MNISNFIQQYISMESIPEISIIDIVEIVILSFLIYQVMVWIKKTKAWMLLKGFAVIGIFVFFAWVFEMNTICGCLKMYSVLVLLLW